MTEKEALKIYDLLREAHKDINRIYREHPALRDENTVEGNAIQAVHSVLYLAEGYFAAIGRGKP